MDAGAGGMTNALPVAFYLRELSGEPERRGGRGLPAGGASESEALIADAHARGVLEGRAAGQVDQDQALAKQAAVFEQKLVAERQRWTVEQADRVCEMLRATFEDIEQRVALHVSDILKPFLLEQVRLKAVEELSASLHSMLSKGDYAKVNISGPRDLLSEIESRVGIAHPGVSFNEGADVDVTVHADDTIIETRIGAWTDSIKDNSQ